MQLTVQQALQLLELQPGATKEQIRAAYKRLALKYHPDKQNASSLRSRAIVSPNQLQPRHDNSSSSPSDYTAAFNLLSAAYQLLTGTAPGTGTLVPIPGSSRSSSNGCTSFEAAYASGTLFNDALINEAVLLGLAPSEVAAIEHLAAAADAGQLAAALTQHPPTAEDEQIWRQLYTRLTIKQQWQQQQQQQQRQQQERRSPGLLAELLTDVLLRPVGDLMVEVSESEQDDTEQEQQQQQHEAAAATAAMQPQPPPQQQQQQQQQSLGMQGRQQRCSWHDNQQQQQQLIDEQQQSKAHGNSTSGGSRSSSSGGGGSGGTTQKLHKRHGWGFYWTWLRRLIVAKAVASILLSGRTRVSPTTWTP